MTEKHMLQADRKGRLSDAAEDPWLGGHAGHGVGLDPVQGRGAFPPGLPHADPAGGLGGQRLERQPLSADLPVHDRGGGLGKG